MRKKFFDDCAQHWEAPSAEKVELVKNRILPLLELKNGENVLDACSGAGAIVPLLLEKGARITEFDYSENMIAAAKKLYGDQAEFVVGDIEKIPFSDAEFDKVICHNSLPHIEDKMKAFKECYRVLKGGGIFLISHSGSKKEIDEHHKKCHIAVCNDMMPSNNEITIFTAAAGFESIEILDEEKYFAVVCKKAK